MVHFWKIENVKNVVWILYLIIVYYAISFQPNGKIFLSNSNSHYVSNKVIAMTNLVKISHDIVLCNRVIYDFQQSSNTTLTAYDDTTVMCKSISSYES